MKMGPMPLADVFHVDPTRLNESGNGWVKELADGRWKVRCVGQHCGVTNRNNRRYPAESTWCRHTLPEAAFAKRVRARRVIGQVEHPTDGRSNMGAAAIVITKVEPPSADGKVFIEWETMATPGGKIIEGFLKSNVGFGLSSRGNGSVVRADDGVDEVQSDYEPITFDAVADESTPGAEVAARAIRESLDRMVRDAGSVEEALRRDREGAMRALAESGLMERKYSPEAQEFISKKMHILKAEHPDWAHSKRVAAAMSMAREKGFGVPENPNEALEAWRRIESVSMVDSDGVVQVAGSDGEQEMVDADAPPPGGEWVLGTEDESGHYRMHEVGPASFDVWFYPAAGAPVKVVDGLRTKSAARDAAESHLHNVVGEGSVREKAQVQGALPFEGTVITLRFDTGDEAGKAKKALGQAGFQYSDKGDTGVEISTEYADSDAAIGHIRRVLMGVDIELDTGLGPDESRDRLEGGMKRRRKRLAEMDSEEPFEEPEEYMDGEEEEYEEEPEEEESFEDEGSVEYEDEDEDEGGEYLDYSDGDSCDDGTCDGFEEPFEEEPEEYMCREGVSEANTMPFAAVKKTVATWVSMAAGYLQTAFRGIDTTNDNWPGAATLAEHVAELAQRTARLSKVVAAFRLPLPGEAATGISTPHKSSYTGAHGDISTASSYVNAAASAMRQVAFATESEDKAAGSQVFDLVVKLQNMADRLMTYSSDFMKFHFSPPAKAWPSYYRESADAPYMVGDPDEMPDDLEAADDISDEFGGADPEDIDLDLDVNERRRRAALGEMWDGDEWKSVEYSKHTVRPGDIVRTVDYWKHRTVTRANGGTVRGVVKKVERVSTSGGEYAVADEVVPYKGSTLTIATVDWGRWKHAFPERVNVLRLQWYDEVQAAKNTKSAAAAFDILMGRDESQDYATGAQRKNAVVAAAGGKAKTTDAGSPQRRGTVVAPGGSADAEKKGGEDDSSRPAKEAGSALGGGKSEPQKAAKVVERIITRALPDMERAWRRGDGQKAARVAQFIREAAKTAIRNMGGRANAERVRHLQNEVARLETENERLRLLTEAMAEVQRTEILEFERRLIVKDHPELAEMEHRLTRCDTVEEMHAEAKALLAFRGADGYDGQQVVEAHETAAPSGREPSFRLKRDGEVGGGAAVSSALVEDAPASPLTEAAVAPLAGVAEAREVDDTASRVAAYRRRRRRGGQ